MYVVCLSGIDQYWEKAGEVDALTDFIRTQFSDHLADHRTNNVRHLLNVLHGSLHRPAASARLSSPPPQHWLHVSRSLPVADYSRLLPDNIQAPSNTVLHHNDTSSPAIVQYSNISDHGRLGTIQNDSGLASSRSPYISSGTLSVQTLVTSNVQLTHANSTLDRRKSPLLSDIHQRHRRSNNSTSGYYTNSSDTGDVWKEDSASSASRILEIAHYLHYCSICILGVFVLQV